VRDALDAGNVGVEPTGGAGLQIVNIDLQRFIDRPAFRCARRWRRCAGFFMPTQTSRRASS
jgi:hypothetical protein